MKTILTPIDFSSVSRKVVAGSIRLARILGARVVLMHVVPPPAYSTDFYGAMIDNTATLLTMAEKAADQYLARLRRRFPAVVRTLPTETGFPVPLILGHARRLQADLIVMGSHGHSIMYDLVLGSTAQGVLKRAPCPVVFVPSPRPRKGKVRK